MTRTRSRPTTQSYNLSVERALPYSLYATASYVGNNTHHLQATGEDPNNPLALENPRNSTQSTRPLPDFGSTSYIAYVGNSNYNSLQTKLEKRLSHGNSLLATYTWSHALDDAPPQLTSTSLDAQYRQSNLIPIQYDYSNSSFDTRHRFTFNAFVEVPVGVGRKYLNRPGVLNLALGGWSTNTTFVAQTGNPFSVSTTGISTAAGGKALAVNTRNEYSAGGTFSSPNPNIVVRCAAQTRTHANCTTPAPSRTHGTPTTSPTSRSITSPPAPLTRTTLRRNSPSTSPASSPRSASSADAATAPTAPATSASTCPSSRASPSTTNRRCSSARTCSTSSTRPHSPSPATTSIDSNGGQITAPRVFQNETPDARFFQFSLKYAF